MLVSKFILLYLKWYFFGLKGLLIKEIPISLLRNRNRKDNKYFVNRTKNSKFDIKIILLKLICNLNWLIQSLNCIKTQPDKTNKCK